MAMAASKGKPRYFVIYDYIVRNNYSLEKDGEGTLGLKV